MESYSSPEQFIRQRLEASAAVTLRARGGVCAGYPLPRPRCWSRRWGPEGSCWLCGNGGSAADCQHLAAEFVNLLDLGHPRPGLAAIALTTDSSLLTAVANDVGFEQVFERPGWRRWDAQGDSASRYLHWGADLRTCCARSGEPRATGSGPWVLTGADGGEARELADVVIRIPSGETQYIQEVHGVVGHLLCALVERRLFG